MAKDASKLLELDVAPGGYDAGDEGDDELDAMKDFLSAVEKKDPKAMQLAFARAYEACAMKHEEPDEDDKGKGY